MTPPPSATPHVLILSGDSILAAPLPAPSAAAGPLPAAPRAFMRRPGPLDAALAPILEALPRRAPLWFFLADAWCQTLSVPSAQLLPLPPPQRLSALAYEAEPFSAIPPATAATAADIAPLDAPSAACRILQAPSADIDAIRRAAEASRHPIAGITHPALLSPLADPDGTPLPDPPPFAPDHATVLLQSLADLLRAGTPPPAIHPVIPPSPLRRVLPAALAISSLLLLLVLLAELILPLADSRLEASLADRSELAAQLSALRNREKSLRDQADALQRDFDAALAPRLGLAALRAAPARLLAALADAHDTPDHALMLRSLTSPAPYAYDIQTWTLTPAHADALYAALAPRLADAGLLLAPNGLQALSLSSDGGPWLASYHIAPDGRSSAGHGGPGAEPPSFSPAPATPGRPVELQIPE